LAIKLKRGGASVLALPTLPNYVAIGRESLIFNITIYQQELTPELATQKSGIRRLYPFINY
jgi:hypothetical protein